MLAIITKIYQGKIRLKIQPKQKFITADVTLDKMNGAVFIFPFFRKDRD